MVATPTRQGRWLSLTWKTLRILLLAYAFACLLAGCASGSLIYHPVEQTAEAVDTKGKAAGMERWRDLRGRPIGMKRLLPAGTAEGAVLIFHGNGGDANACAWYATMIQRHARLDCYALEYPGYEDRPGKAGRDAILTAAQESLATLKEGQPLYLVGESLGSGVAAFLAGENPGRISGLMLLSPYQSLGDVAQAHFPWLPARWLIRDNDFKSAEYLRKYHGRVGILVDGMDEVVPADCGRSLFDGYAGPKRLWLNPTGGHLELDRNPDAFWKDVVDFWRSGPKSGEK